MMLMVMDTSDFIHEETSLVDPCHFFNGEIIARENIDGLISQLPRSIGVLVNCRRTGQWSQYVLSLSSRDLMLTGRHHRLGWSRFLSSVRPSDDRLSIHSRQLSNPAPNFMDPTELDTDIGPLGLCVPSLVVNQGVGTTFRFSEFSILATLSFRICRLNGRQHECVTLWRRYVGRRRRRVWEINLGISRWFVDCVVKNKIINTQQK